MVVSLERKQAEQIIQAVGGATNIERVIHCVTRLRFYLVDPSKLIRLGWSRLMAWRERPLMRSLVNIKL